MSKASISYDFINIVLCIYTVLQILWKYQHQFSSVQLLSHVWLFVNPKNAAHLPGLPIHQQLPELAHSCPSSQWCHQTISSSVDPFFTHLQSFPASGCFAMSQFLPSDGQSTGVSASASVLPMNIQDWFPLGLTSWISLQSNGLSRVFSNTTVQKHQVFCAQLTLWSNSHIHIWLLEKP